MERVNIAEKKLNRKDNKDRRMSVCLEEDQLKALNHNIMNLRGGPLPKLGVS